jgi:hypothetical protein
MDLFFEDVDLYITVAPEEFEEAFYLDAVGGLATENLVKLASVSEHLDVLGEFELSSALDSVIEVFAGKAKYKGKSVTLNKPFRTPKGPKKFSVYVKNDKGNVVKVNFGDPKMDIKRDSPKRRKSFRARHKCENPGPKWKAKYWACKTWSKKPVSKIVS